MKLFCLVLSLGPGIRLAGTELLERLSLRLEDKLVDKEPSSYADKAEAHKYLLRAKSMPQNWKALHTAWHQKKFIYDEEQSHAAITF
eukprot:6199527-Pleurochrysis_carterae.AAC.1